MYQLNFMLMIILCFLFSPVVEAKKRCKPLLEKLHNIQALQRNGHSAKQGLSLRGREDKARDQWWQCENGRNKTKGKSKKKVKNKSRAASDNNQPKRIKSHKLTAGTPFKTSNAIVIKSKYEGDKKQAWLKYYQQPDKCVRPKSLAIFAFCSENKQMQQTNFDKQYRE